MGLLQGIAKAIRGHSCERLVKQTKNEYDIQGVGFGIADFKVEVGNFSNKIERFYEVTGAMANLDNTQYLMCILKIKFDRRFSDLVLFSQT